MASMFGSHTIITGGTFTQAQSYHGSRESSEILHRATATAAFHNSKERFDPPKCHPKTRVAILTAIMKWIKWEGNLESFIIWVYGAAGAGKSAIAQTIAEMCELEMILLASFFFSGNDPSRSNSDPLVATLAYQITLNLPDTREAILGAIERDPLIFKKSLAFQVESVIIEPLQRLVDAGFFNDSTSRRLIIIDGLDECFEPKVQQHIVEVLANSQRQRQLPLIFLIASRPEQHISFAFSTGFLPGVTTRIALDDSYLPDNDIELFLTDKFQEIKSSHPRRAYIPPQWPLPDVLNQLVRKSSGQFIYASTIIRYITSSRHKPTDRLDIILGIRPPQRDLPFSELDALYTQIFAGVEDIERVLEILSTILLSTRGKTSNKIEKFLSLQPGDVELYLWDLHSLINHDPDPDRPIRVFHASLTDFLVDPTRSKTLWIDPRARHTAFARRCLQILQIKGDLEILKIAYYDIDYQLENAEMTPELCDDLSHFSLDSLRDVLEDGFWGSMMIHPFSPRFLECLKTLPLPEADEIWRTFQTDFNRMLCNILEKYHSYPGFALLLGSILQYRSLRRRSVFPPGMVTYLYLVRKQGEGHVLDDIGLSGIFAPNDELIGTTEFFAHLVGLLGDPDRSGIHTFDEQKYATAAKECLELCLCSHHEFSMEAKESACRDKELLRNKPWVWKTRLGVHSRLRKTMHHLTVQRWKLLRSGKRNISQFHFLLLSPSQHQDYRFLTYHWALDLLPLFLEKSVISLELANLLRSRTFTTMAQRFPGRVKLAREAIRTYLSRVDSALGDP